MPDVVLKSETIGPQLMRIDNLGRALEQGDGISIEYGAGEMGARADLYAESESRFWIAVDGDGDGVRKVLEDSPFVRVLPDKPARCVLTVTSRARPGEDCALTIAILDRYANSGVEYAGTVELDANDSKLQLPASVEIPEEAKGLARISFAAPDEGVYRIGARVTHDDTTFTAISNPLLVRKGAEPLYWADLHGHSSYSDGTGTPREYLTYARDVAGLDVIALTDHDHYGVLFLDDHEERWQEIQDLTAEFHQEGVFVALLGYEWTNWIYGHRHVLYFEDHGHVHSSVSEEADTPTELWDILRGQPAMTITHHSAGSPVANDWSIPPDPELEPLAEIMSVHGSSEAVDSPSRLKGFMSDYSVRSALGRGYRLGFIGSGDSHDGHPGLPHLSPSYGYRPATERRPERMGTGGLAAVEADSLTRESILSALRKRATYATSGPRILLSVSVGDVEGGAVLQRSTLPEKAQLEFRVHGTATVESIELIVGQEVASVLVSQNQLDLEGSFDLAHVRAGDFAYVRILQSDGGIAWSSPIWFE